MNNTNTVVLSVLSLVLATGCGDTIADDTPEPDTFLVTEVTLETFQVPELVPNEPLEEMEPVEGSSGTLVRGADELFVSIATHGLPAGAYTFWWHLTHADEEVSILWAGNYMVDDPHGSAAIASTLPEGEENAPGEIFIGHGLQPGAAKSVVVELWVRSHGPPSDDPDILAEQLSLPFGLCTDSRNPNPRPDDYPCWNPHRAFFGGPEAGRQLIAGD